MRKLSVSYTKQSLIFTTIILLLTLFPLPVMAASPAQSDDPVSECAQGVQLFLDGKSSEALPLLIAGFSNRNSATFTNIDDLGKCALALGILYQSVGKTDEGLEADQVALQAFQESNNLEFQGNVLHAIGTVYQRQGRTDEALDAFKQSLEIARKIGDRAGESPTLNEIAGIYSSQGKYDEAMDTYQEALSLATEVEDQTSEAAALVGMSAIFYSRGQYDEAMQFSQKALDIYRDTGDQHGEATVLGNMGRLQNDQGLYPEALQNFQKSLEISQALGDRVSEGDALNYLGITYFELGRYEEAYQNFQEALNIAREVSDRGSEANAINNVAMLYEKQGKLSHALSGYQQALGIYRDIKDRSNEGILSGNTGRIYKLLGQYDEALQYYESALKIQQELGNRPEESLVLNNIGTVYDKQGKYTLAMDYYMEALKIHREVNDRQGEGRVLGNIGLLYEEQGQHEQALSYYQQSLDILKSLNDSEGQGYVLNNLGGVYDDLGEYSQALDFYQQAFDIIGEGGNLQLKGEVLANIGYIYNQQGNYAAAQDKYEISMTLLESIRSSSGTETARTSYIAENSNIYNLAIELYLQENLPEEAFLTSERGRARAFLDSMVTGHIDPGDESVQLLYRNEQEAYDGRQNIQEQLAKAKAQTPQNMERITKLETQLVEAESTYQTTLDAISDRNNQLEQLVPGRSKVLNSKDVQALLDGQTTLLSFWILDDQVLAFILTYDDFHIVILPVSHQDLHSHIANFRSFADTSAAYPKSAVLLYQELIEPLRQQITTTHLMIVPHAELHYLPFSALTDGQQYLLDDYVITYLPSASVLPYINANATGNNGSPVILGNPVTGTNDTSDVLAFAQDQLAPLPYAEEEAENIAGQLGIEPYLQTAATESLVRQRAPQASIIHFAAHGVFNPAVPLDSLIALAPDATNDGWLTAGEIYGLDFHNTDLVVLSACNTQLGQLTAGDEFIGLTRAFFFAGAPTVVSSLWSVDDQSTAVLMERFYVHLKEGMGKAEALTKAQMDVREKYPNPYYWAGFVLSGSSGNIAALTPAAPVSNDKIKVFNLPCISALAALFLVMLMFVASKRS